MHPFRFAVQGGPWRDPEATVALARTVESLGYDELYSSDHIGGADPYVPLVHAAAATERIAFGPLVLNNEFHHPALVQACFVGDAAPSAAELGERFELDEQVIVDTPFALSGSVDQIVDKLERLRDRTGISHYVVREPEAFAPIVEALSGR